MVASGWIEFNILRSILYTVDPSVFASLSLLNRKWRRISDTAPLYAHHLARCPSFPATQDSVPYSESLDSLKHRFFAEVRRNAFNVFLRPRQTLVKLISTSMSSSTAFPKGEAFRFSFSSKGQMILCISSSRIVVLDVTTKLPVVKHELKTSRRPLDATILDDGSLLAVVSSRHQINIYSLSDDDSKLIQCLALNDTPQALALSPTGGVLAIAYDDRIEMQAVGEGVLATDRRAVRCNRVDSISFSADGFMLLGSSARGRTSSIVSVTVPFYTGTEDDVSPGDAQVRMWTTQVLFPATLPGYTRACSLPLHGEGEDDWVIGYDEQRGAFKVVRISNANADTVYFPSPFSANIYQKASPVTSPAVDSRGELVALGYEDSGLWVHGIPNRLDVASSSPGFLQESGAINGHKMCDIPGITAACWVGYSHSSDHPASKGLRLVTVAPGGVSPPSIGEEDVPVDGGRVLLLDFDRSPRDGETIEISIELGEAEPKMLTEPNSSLDTEVELERRRTQLRRNNTAAPRRLRNAARETHPAAVSSASQKTSYRHRRNSSYQSSSNTTRLNATSFGDAQPRTGDTLQRAATAAAVNPRRSSNPRQPQMQRYIPQIPHESDADNWVPPPPPYTREPDAPLPENLRRTLLPVPPELRRAQSTAQDNSSRNRPALHRLNTITARMMRMGIRDPHTDEDDLRQRGVLQRIREGALGQSNHGRDEPVPPVPPVPAIPQAHQLPAAEEFTITQYPQYINSAPAAPQAPQTLPAPLAPLTPSETPASSRSRRQSTRSNQTEQVVSQAVASNLMEPIPYIQEEESPTTIDQNQYPFSLSSPNLGGPGQRFTGTAEESPASPTARRTWYQRVPNGRSQSQDIREVMPPRPTPAMNRRASTDPTLSNRSPSTAAVNENWRRRIEEWNERTIYETNKKNRKCVVM